MPVQGELVKIKTKFAKAMKNHPLAELPEINSNYLDEYGEIDMSVYVAGTSIWPYAQAFALKITNDEDQARDLMLRAIALVSRRKRDHAIGNMKGYLIVVYKRCVWEEARRAKRFECCPLEKLENLYERADTELERVILVKEIVAKMDIEMVSIFERLILGYSFNEIAEEIHISPKTLRNKFRRRLEKLADHIRDEMKNGGSTHAPSDQNGTCKKSYSLNGSLDHSANRKSAKVRSNS